MRFEKDKRTGDTVKTNVIVYIAFIGVALGLTARNCFTDPPKYLLAVTCLACGVYMVIYLLRFIRLLKGWERTCLEIDGDRVRGLSIDPKSFRAEPFDIGLAEVEDASLQEIKLTRRSPLPVLTIRTESHTYTVVGIENMQAARNRLLPKESIY